MAEAQELRLIKEAITDINDALSGVDAIKEGLGLRGRCAIEDSLEAAKMRLKRIITDDIGQL